MTDPPAGVEDLTASIEEAELVELTCELVRAAGENPGAGEAATVQVLADACRRRGLEVHLSEAAPDRPNLVAVLPASESPTGAPPSGLLFLGHSDVVPAGSGWSGDPFEPVVARGRIRGRGTSDMKGGLAAVVVALDALRRSGLSRSHPVALACTVDEEDLGIGIRHLVAEGLPAALTGRMAGCVVAEPTDLGVVVGCRGDSFIEITVHGVPAHSGRPQDGRNAIDAAAAVLGLLRRDEARLAGDPDPLLGHGTWSVGRIQGGQGTSIVAADCRLWVDRRLMPDEDAEQVADHLRREIAECGISGDGIGVEVAVTMKMPGFFTPADHPLVSDVLEAAVGAGGSPAIGGWTAACDGGFVSREMNLPTVVFGPGGLTDQAHQVDESVGIGELLKAARTYALLAAKAVAGAGGFLRLEAGPRRADTEA